tara:strand:- start:2447 stop:2950 length:504 start_codon:yes stop_codon:yes gene_type:complete
MNFSLLSDNEKWLDVEGYEGLYSVSNMGRVMSYRRNIILKGTPCQKEYLQVGLWKDGHRRTIKIHALVGMAFVGKRENGLTYDHMDRNRLNNRADNIRLATQSEQNINKNVQLRSQTGEKNIAIYRNCYRIQIRRNEIMVFDKSLPMENNSLEYCVKIRDEFLQSLM